MTGLTVWTDFQGDLRLVEEAVKRSRLLVGHTGRAAFLDESGSDPSLRGAEVAFGQPNVEDLLVSDSLRWVHLSSAGYTRYDRADLRERFETKGITLTNSSSVYDDPCAQHVLAFMLAHCRCILQSVSDQGSQEWATLKLRKSQRVLGGQNVLIFGFGAIGRRLADLLAPFGCEIRALRRTPDGLEGVRTFPIGSSSELLPWADHVVNLLPLSSSTEGYFDHAKFGLMKHGAAFYNVGRGDTVDQVALVEALESERLSGAYLDVTSPEPLPPGSPLWKARNCLLTPHVAGGLQGEELALVGHFRSNLEKFQQGEKLQDVVFGPKVPRR